MAIDEKVLHEIAGSVSDGALVDWKRLESMGRMAEIRNLRHIEDITAFHRRASLAVSSEASTVDAPQPAPRQTRAVGAAPPMRAWGHLERLKLIGQGSYGEVYRAFDPRLDREVALKLLHLRDGDEESRALHEGRLLARMNQRNVATVYGVENRNGRVGLWMEYIRGRTLEEIVKEQGPLSASEAGLIGIDVCRALAAVHRMKLVHRDVKAQNVMREEGGRIVLMDFGIGKTISDSDGQGLVTITGTPLYMAPEIMKGTPAGIATDIYSVGVLLFFLVTGRYPAEGKTMFEIHKVHESGSLRLLRDVRQDLPPAFVRIVERALSIEPGARFATAGQMEKALESALNLDAPPDEPVVEAVIEDPPRPPVWRRPAALWPSLFAAAVLAFLVIRGVTSAGYEIQADFYRTDREERTEVLANDSRVRLGDLISLEVKASRRLHVYVVNGDDRGESYLLFPMSGASLGNPIPAGQSVSLPGLVDGERTGWKITSAGGRERFLVIASPEPLTELEAQLGLLSRPEPGQPVQLAEGVLRGIRGAGGTGSIPVNPGADAGARIFQMARNLAGGSHKAKNVWSREIEVLNPPETGETQNREGAPQ